MGESADERIEPVKEQCHKEAQRPNDRSEIHPFMTEVMEREVEIPELDETRHAMEKG